MASKLTPAPKPRDAERSRAAILDAAEALFAEMPAPDAVRGKGLALLPCGQLPAWQVLWALWAQRRMPDRARSVLPWR